MATFRIAASEPDAIVFETTALANGGFVATILEYEEGSASRFAAVKFALFTVNEAGEAERVGTTFTLDTELPTGFFLAVAPLADGGFSVMVGDTDTAAAPSSLFVRYDELGVEQSRTDLAVRYTGTSSYEATLTPDEPVIWLRNLDAQRFEVLSPLTGLPVDPTEAHAGGFTPSAVGLDGGLIVKTVFDGLTQSNSFVADWIDDRIDAPAPVFATLQSSFDNALIAVGNQMVSARTTQDLRELPDGTFVTDTAIIVDMAKPDASAATEVLRLDFRNDRSLRAFDLAELPGIGFALLHVTSPFATAKVSRAELILFNFSGEEIGRKLVNGPVGDALLRHGKIDLMALPGATGDRLRLAVIWEDDPDSSVLRHVATEGEIVTFSDLDIGSIAQLGTSFGDLLRGLGANDSLLGGAGNDRIFGGGGADALQGDLGDDVLSGDDGRDRIEGDAGADLIFAGAGVDLVIGGEGADTAHGDDGGDLMSGGLDEDSLLGGDGNDTITGDDGNDDISGNQGNDGLLGGDGDDVLSGDSGHDKLNGDAGDDLLLGFAGNDTLRGGNGDDDLIGTNGDDRLEGGSGNDTLSGDAGNDILIGGTGADHLSGGDGTDIFRFLSPKDSPLDAADLITDFLDAGDRIDLSAIDARTNRRGNDAFVFIENADFSGKSGELRVDDSESTLALVGDRNGDGIADFLIEIARISGIEARDLIL